MPCCHVHIPVMNSPDRSGKAWCSSRGDCQQAGGSTLGETSDAEQEQADVPRLFSVEQAIHWSELFCCTPKTDY